jgi:ribosome-associated protein YbcJ (S4-like RNA binding protein)
VGVKSILSKENIKRAVLNGQLFFDSEVQKRRGKRHAVSDMLF